MRVLAVWTLGTVYLLAAIAGMVAIVWAADYKDNSADPTPWVVGAAIVLAPMAMFGAWQLKGLWSFRRVEDRRVWITIGVAVGAALIFGAQEVVADASACNDDDCARVAVPVTIAIVLGAWSLPLGVWTLRRVRYPSPLLSAGLVAVLITTVAALAAAVQATRQEDDYADLTLGIILLVWVLPAVVAVVGMVVLRGPVGAAAHRTAAGRTAAGYLVAVGCWFVAMPFAAGIDSDSLPVLLAVSGGPGVVLLTVGLAALAFRSRAGR